MKRFQIVLLVMPLFYWAGCGDDENEDNPVIPGRKIYIAGSDADGACYWVNGSRVELPGVIGRQISWLLMAMFTRQGPAV